MASHTSASNAAAPHRLEPLVLCGLSKAVHPSIAQLLADQERAIKHLHDRLTWHVQNDDVNLGQEGNEYWEGGYYRGLRALR